MVSKMSDLAVIGCVSIDNIRVPGKIYQNVFGGSGGYAAVAASFFTKVHLISNIGTDFPAETLDKLKGLGINTSGLRVIEGKSTHFDVEYGGELADEYYHAADMNVGNDEIVLPELINECKFVYLSANDPDIQIDIMYRLKKGITIALDTHAMWIESKRDRVLKAFEMADIVFVNSNEAKMFSGKRIVKNAAKAIMEEGVERLVIKKGAHGGILFTAAEMYPMAAYDDLDMLIVDPTGCGDSTAGGFMGTLAANDDAIVKLNNIYKKALVFDMVTASFNLMDYSIHKMLTIDREDVWHRYDRFRDMLRM